MRVSGGVLHIYMYIYIYIYVHIYEHMYMGVLGGVLGALRRGAQRRREGLLGSWVKVRNVGVMGVPNAVAQAASAIGNPKPKP